MAEIHDRIVELLQMSKRPISSKEMSKLLMIDDGEAQPFTRSLILETMKIKKISISANGRGYFITRNKVQLNAYIKTLHGRMKGIKEREYYVTKYFKPRQIKRRKKKRTIKRRKPI